MTVAYVESTKTPGLRFRILSYNPETKQGVLIGELQNEFETDMSKERLLKNNYVVKAYEDADDPGLPGEKKAVPA